MATVSEQPKPPAAQDHPYPQNVVPYPQPYNPAFPPPPPGYPPFFAYPPTADPPHAENGQSPVPPAPYMMAFAPSGMVYAYPTPQGTAFAPPATSVPPTLVKPKRKQVKMACTNCAAACKRCDESRPCERCIKYGMSNTCVDGQRKERKKGIKRGPYKRKNKTSDANSGYPPEWPAGQPTTTTAPPAPGIPVPHQFPTEGFYQVYYGPPGPFLTHPPDAQPTGPDGSPPPPPPLPHHPHVNGQPAMLPPYFYATYPPFPHYPPMFPPPGPPPPPAALPPGVQPTPQQPSAAHPPQATDAASPSSSGSSPSAGGGEMSHQTPPASTASTTSTNAEAPLANPSEDATTTTATATATKKRTRGAAKANGMAGESRVKRSKVTRSAANGKEKEREVTCPEENGKDGDADANGSGNESSA